MTEEIRYANFRGRRVYVYDPLEDAEKDDPHPFDQDEIGSRARARAEKSLDNSKENKNNYSREAIYRRSHTGHVLSNIF